MLCALHPLTFPSSSNQKAPILVKRKPVLQVAGEAHDVVELQSSIQIPKAEECLRTPTLQTVSGLTSEYLQTYQHFSKLL